MENDFVLIANASDIYEAELIRGLLEENGIEVNVINKKDSEFLIGEVEIYVTEEDAARAKEILSHQDEE